MSFVLKVMHKNKIPPERVTVGIRVRQGTVRNTIEVPVVYKEYEYHANGKPVMGQVVRTRSANGTTIQTIDSEHLCRQETKTYTVQKNAAKWETGVDGVGGGRVIYKQPIRFINMVKPIAEALIGAYGRYLDIRYAMTEKQYAEAEENGGGDVLEYATDNVSALDGSKKIARRANTPTIVPDGTCGTRGDISDQGIGVPPEGYVTLPSGKHVKLQTGDELFDGEDDGDGEKSEE